MTTFAVTAFAVVRIKVNDVEAASAREAIDKVRSALPLDELLNNENMSGDINGVGELTYVANGDDIRGFLVDSYDESEQPIDDGVPYDSYGFPELGADNEHAEFTRQEWVNAVANRETVNGYQDWVSHQLQSRAEATAG
jgi:hypothetical protein